MKIETNVRILYNNQADDWCRKEPVLLSDYSARPFVLDHCEPLAGLNILDIGCGEGYVGREMLKRGADNILGLDISEKMIGAATEIQNQQGLEGLHYAVKDIRESVLPKGNYDLVMAMFLFNYLTIDEMKETMAKVLEVLKPGGHFVFSVPHPFLAFLKKDKYPFYFIVKDGYFSGRNNLFPGEIWRRDGQSVNVQCVHKTIEDYFHSLNEVGFNSMPKVHELRINEEHLKMDPEFFGPLKDLPLHMAFKVTKNYE